MAPGTHLLISWLGSSTILKNRRERILVTIAGIAPDLDGAGIIADTFTQTTNYYHAYHHIVGHTIFSALLFALMAMFIAKNQRIITFFLTFFIVHIHYICDIAGSKAPDGFQWPLHYLYPINSSFELSWSGQWHLNSWQNLTIVLITLILCGIVATKKNITPFELINQKFDSTAMSMLNKFILRKKEND